MLLLQAGTGVFRILSQKIEKRWVETRVREAAAKLRGVSLNAVKHLASTKLGFLCQ